MILSALLLCAGDLSAVRVTGRDAWLWAGPELTAEQQLAADAQAAAGADAVPDVPRLQVPSPRTRV